jgi:hypothetical protein
MLLYPPELYKDTKTYDRAKRVSSINIARKIGYLHAEN